MTGVSTAKNTEQKRHKNIGQGEVLIEKMAEDPRLLRMKSFIQHGRVNTYDHCLSVARLSLKLARGLHLKVDSEELVRGALLHDYYLYDWHTRGDRLHGYHHPAIAADQADKDFSLTRKERNIIRTHMWPLTLGHMPSSKEAALVCVADKLCSAKETLMRKRWRRKSNEHENDD